MIIQHSKILIVFSTRLAKFEHGYRVKSANCSLVFNKMYCIFLFFLGAFHEIRNALICIKVIKNILIIIVFINELKFCFHGKACNPQQNRIT